MEFKSDPKQTLNTGSVLEYLEQFILFIFFSSYVYLSVLIIKFMSKFYRTLNTYNHLKNKKKIIALFCFKTKIIFACIPAIF